MEGEIWDIFKMSAPLAGVAEKEQGTGTQLELKYFMQIFFLSLFSFAFNFICWLKPPLPAEGACLCNA